MNGLEIIKPLFEWTEFLAQEKYKEAFEMFLSDEKNEPDWTGTLGLLELAVFTYGCPFFLSIKLMMAIIYLLLLICM